MEGLLEPELVEEPLGQVEVRCLRDRSRAAVDVVLGQSHPHCKVRCAGQMFKSAYEGVLDSLKWM